MSYIIKYTDPLKTSFNVQPYTTNGRVNPTLTPLDPSAVTSDSSLLIYGKGMPDYGQNIQNNLLHIVENFASPASNPPLDQTEGQLWYNNTALELKIWEPAGPTPTTWSSVLLDTGTAPMRADFDLNNNRLLNVPTVPGAATDAVNEQYVLNHEADTALHLSIEQNDLLDDLETLYAATANLADLADQLIALEDFDVTAGRTIETALTLKADRVVPAPLALGYIATLDLLGNIVDSGSLVTDFFPAGPHTHDATAVNFAGPYGDLSGGTNVQIILQELQDEKAALTGATFTGDLTMSPGQGIYLAGVPTDGNEAATKDYVDAEVANIVFAESGVTRRLITSTGTDVYFAPSYVVGLAGLQVFVNGQKYYANSVGYQEVFIANDFNTGLTNDATIYSFNIDVDGTGNQLMLVAGQDAQLLSGLASQISLQLATDNVTIISSISGSFLIQSNNNTGVGASSISITDIDLFSSLLPHASGISSVDTGLNQFTVENNDIHRFQVGASFNVVNSTGNDGSYTILSSTYTHSTGSIVISVASITDPTIDGEIEVVADIQPALSGSLQGYREEGIINNTSSVIVFNAPVPTAGQVIEVLASN